MKTQNHCRLLVASLLLAGPFSAAADEAAALLETFDSWTQNTDWAQRTHTNGWSIADAQVRSTRTTWIWPYTAPNAAWLHGTGGTSRVQSPALPQGAEFITFQACRHDTNNGTGTLAIQYGVNATNWVTLDTFAIRTNAWSAYSIYVGDYRPGALRWVQTGATSTNLYISLDQLYVGQTNLVIVPDPATNALRACGPSSRRTPLTITEIMYHPAARGDGRDLEYIELFNSEPVTNDIGGFHLTGDIDYTFPAGQTLAPRAFLIVAHNPGDVQAVYGITHVLGPFTNSLPDDRGTLRLSSDRDAILLDADYASTPPWPLAAAGNGYALWLSRPDHGEGSPRAWSAGIQPGGSPGQPEPDIPNRATGLVISEIRPDDSATGFVELYNGTAHDLDLTEYGLSDDATTNKHIISASAATPSGGFAFFTATELGFPLNPRGGTLFLRYPRGQVLLDAVAYGPLPGGATAGRTPTSNTDFMELAYPTPGASNAPEAAHDIVINEIMFAPLSGLDADQYIELFNRGTQTVSLANWQLTDGVELLFPETAAIPAGQYLVVARNLTNLLARYPHLNAGNTAGNYRGTLSGRGERIALARPRNPAEPYQDLMPVDEVTYSDGWGEWADGGGSSLELTDPRSDNRLGMNWAGSDETTNAPWVTVSYTGQVPATSSASVGIYHMQSGEFLVDDVEVVNAGVNRVSNPTFNSGSSGWSVTGTHLRSGRDTAGGTNNSACYHVRASDRGTDAENRITGTLSSTIAAGANITMRAKVRWLCGWPYAAMVLTGGAIEVPLAMAVPPAPGTPGRRNSRYLSNGGPAISDVLHAPLLPGALAPVIVTCRASDPDPLAAVRLKYRVDPATNYTTVAMADTGTNGDARANDGIYSASITGRPAGTLVAFYIEAADAGAGAATNRFPKDPPTRECLVRWGNARTAGVLGTYVLWITQAAANTWSARSPYSNEPFPGTFVYDEYRVNYLAQARWRGNSRIFDAGPLAYYDDPKTGVTIAMGGIAIEVSKDNRIMGDNEVNMDQCGQISRDWTLQTEPHSYWIAGKLGLPYCYMRFAHMFVNGSDRGTMHDIDLPSPSSIQNQFPGSGYEVYKQEGELGVYETAAGAANNAIYRFNWVKRATDIPDDRYDSVHLLARAIDTTNASLLEARLDALVDKVNWMGYFAVNHLVGNEDSWGYYYAHNCYLAASLQHKAKIFTYDHDWSLGSSINSGSQSDSIWHNENAHPVPAKLYLHPSTRRLHLRHCKEGAALWMGTEGNNKMTERYQALLANHAHYALDTGPVAVASPSSMLAWTAVRKSSVLSQVDAAGGDAAFAVTSPADEISTNARVLTVAGTAPVEVDRILINSNSYRMSFTSVSNWTIKVGLNPGTNRLAIAAVDRFGNTVGGTVTRNVTCEAPDTPFEGQVIINEVMYDPPAGGAEFVELRNLTGTEIDLSGWAIEGVDGSIDHGVVLPANGYLVMARDPQTYYYAYTNVEKMAGGYAGALDNNGESLTLARPKPDGTWETVDALGYDDAPPWPATSSGGGDSLQVIDGDKDNQRVGNWAAGAPTPGEANSIATNLPAFPLLWLNEIMASNLAAVADNQGDHDPWVELYNAGETPIMLDGYFLSDEITDLQRWAFPSGAVINAGAHQLVWLDNETHQQTETDWHASFLISSAGGCVALARADLGRTILVDALPYGPMAPDHSYGTWPEGISMDRYVFHHPTPGTTNINTSDPAPIRINEWMALNTNFLADPSDGQFDDWVELYNDGDERVPLDGYLLTDNPSSPTRFMIPAGVWMDGHSFLFIWADESPAAYIPGFAALHASFSLGRYGEMITLYAPDGTQIDQAIYGPQDDNASEGRWPDGHGGVHRMAYWPTPGTSNVVFMVQEMAALANDSFALSAPARSGSVFRLEYNGIVASNDWLLDSIFTAETSVATFPTTPATPDVTQRFYRLIKIP